ncbi:MAG TPA: Omp28-related outer membrane protein [Bacteroidia bacterium]|nr:Omp28-related outer membrane protein [Bacteroidia bacterium]HQF27177.1 Omp28-related outer membrane protein [Bacteroidia bacterium]HQK96959.1 Omp28-related outer membrane protein [Bacteroidia bacterium]
MKNILSKLVLATGIALMLGSIGCDKVEGPYGVKSSTGGTDTTDTIVRKVLLEDFTGHTCQACPASHAEAQRLKAIYGDRLIIMGVHAGFFAKPQPSYNPPFPADFRTQVATDIATDFNVINLPFPKGMVNRLYDSGTGVQKILEYADWEVNVDTMLQRAADAGLDITNSFSSGDSMMTATISVTMVNNYSNQLNLAVYFVEDSIVSPQKDGTNNIMNYVHRHMLRGTFNGTYGESVGTGLTSGQEVTKTYSTKLTPTDAVVNQVYVYALLFDNVTKQIVQVEEKKLIP